MARRILRLALSVALLVTWLPFSPPSVASAAPPLIKAGMVTDTGGLGDASFNDATYAGLVRAESELGADIQALESASNADYGPNIDTLVTADTDVVFTVGFLMTDITKAKALASPGTVFAGVDEYFDEPSANLLGMSFKEHEAAYLAGVVAGLGTLDTGLDARINAQNTIAFIGGMDIPPVERFEAGFVAGAKSVNADVEVLISYADAFDNEALGESLALDAISQGADIVFAAAGGTGLGSIKACQDAGALFIGVDSDQYVTVPGSGDVMLTSAMKRPEGAVFQTVKDVVDGTFVGGQNREFGLAEDGVGIAPFHDFETAVSQDIKDAVEAARLSIVGGSVVVPSQRVYTYDLVTDGVLTVGTSPDFPPFEFMEGGEYAGFDVELVAAIAERLGLTYAFADYPFDSLIGVLQGGSQIDMIASAMTITPGREALVDFSDPYCEDPGSPGSELGFAFNEANPGLRDAVNDALADLRADGTYDDIYARWLGGPSEPFFSVSPLEPPEHMWGQEWEADSEVLIEIDDPNVAGAVNYMTTASTDGAGRFELYNMPFDIEAGHVVTVTQGSTIKTHGVIDLTVTSMNPDTDVVSGVGAPNRETVVNVDGREFSVTSDGSGAWTVDVSTEIDVQPGMGTYVYQPDEDNDQTQVDYFIANPQFSVRPDVDEVAGSGWTPNETIRIDVDGLDADSLPDFQFDGSTNEWGDFWWMNAGADIQAGYTVTVTQGSTSKSHVVTALEVTDVDPEADTVSGTAAPGSEVEVWGHEQEGMRRVTASPTTGAWTADFSVPADPGTGNPDDDRAWDLMKGSAGGTGQRDDDGDSTEWHWSIANPQFYAAPARDGMGGNEWPAGADLLVTIDDLATPLSPDYVGNAQVGQWGEFDMPDLGGFDLAAGQLVTVTDGATTKTHVVTVLQVTGVDSDADTVSGTADPDSQVDVWVDDADVFRTVTADAEGDWIADFSADYDIVPGSQGVADQRDDDSDGTSVDWNVPNPFFAVSPIDPPDHMWGEQWVPGSDVLIEIDDPGVAGVVNYTTTAATDGDGRFELYDMPFNIQAGHIVTVTQGSTVKTHEVIDLKVTSMDPDTDVVSGVGAPNKPTVVWIWSDTGESQLEVVSDGDGTWVADFSGQFDIQPGMTTYAYQTDEDNDQTQINHQPPGPPQPPAFEVHRWPSEAMVYVKYWPTAGTVDVTVDDPATLKSPDFEAQGATEDFGEESYGCTVDIVGYDVKPGDVVAVSDATTSKQHTVIDIAVTSVDADDDMVHGTAAAGSQLTAYSSEANRWFQADGSGDWTADFSTAGPEESVFDIVPGTAGGAEQFDDDGDSTVIDWDVPRPEDWQHNPANGHDYLWTWGEDVQSWADAEAYAIELGGHLVSINNQAEMDWLVQTLGADYSIGLNDIAAEGTWVWSSGEPVTFTDWLSDEPNSSGNEDAVMIWNRPPIGWNDIPADGGNAFVVEVEPSVDTTPPTVALAVTPASPPSGTSGWYPAAPSIRASADEPAAFFYSFVSNTGPWTPWLDPTTPVLAPQGTSTFNCYAVDSAANTSTVTSRAFKVDATAPSTPGTPYVTALGKTSVTIAWAPSSDAYSGVAGYLLYDGGVLATEPTGASHTFTGLTPGSAHSYTVAARDVAGNLSTPSPALPVTLLPANTAPVANADGPYQIPEDAVLTTSAPGLLSNDTDADGDPLTADLVSDVSYGTLVLNANGSFTYTPPSNFSGAATFTYRAFDGLSYSNGVTVTIAVTPVNDSPIANDDTATTAEDTALSVIAANGVLANDSDSDSLLLTAARVASPAHGTLALATNGSYVYTPTTNWSGTDTFTYRASDGSSYSGITTVTVTVTPVNDPPVTTADGPYSTLEGVSLTLPAPGLLANDTDVEGDPLTAVKTANPAHGTLTLNANGGFTYTPAAGYNGADSFTYKSNDGHADSAPAIVTITVTPKAATALSVTSGSATIDYGSTYLFAGILKLGALALPGQTVTLEQSTDGTTFSASSLTALTGVGGAFTTSAKPTSKTWYRAVFAETGPYLGSTSGAVVITVRPYVQTPIAPKTMKRTKSYTVYGALKPAHAPGSKPVRIYKYRKIGKTWKGSGYVKAVAYDYKGYTRYKVSMRLSTKGSWRLRAYAPADTGHLKMWSSKFDYVTVK